MKRIISFSLWGNNPKYCIGAMKNLYASRYIYPDWTCRFYVSEYVDKDLVDRLISGGAEVIVKSGRGNWTSMFWRFEAGYDESADAVIFRDADSRLSAREAYAVDDWLRSGTAYHIMRDHPYHGYKILGGMWGVRPKLAKNLKQLLDSFSPSNEYGTDYKFFGEVLFDKIGNDKLTHDEFFEKKPFPVARCGLEFVGQVFNENEECPQEHLNAIRAK